MSQGQPWEPWMGRDAGLYGAVGTLIFPGPGPRVRAYINLTASRDLRTTEEWEAGTVNVEPQYLPLVMLGGFYTVEAISRPGGDQITAKRLRCVRYAVSEETIEITLTNREDRERG